METLAPFLIDSCLFADYPRRRLEASVAYNKQDLEKLKVHIHRTDMQEQKESHPTHNLRRDVDPSDFHVPRKYGKVLWDCGYS